MKRIGTGTTSRLAAFLLIAAVSCGGSKSNSAPTTPVAPAPEAKPAEPPPAAGDTKPAEPAKPEVVHEAPAPELPWPNDAYRAKQPDGSAPRPVKLPKIAKGKLANGVDVYLVERHELPMVSLELQVDGGDLLDPAGKEGLAGMCTGLMGDGTEKLDQIAFEEAKQDLASTVGAGAGIDSQSVSMRSLSKNLDATLDLWADVLLHPGLRADDFERDRKSEINAIKQLKGSPEGIAGRVSNSVFFGETHPYARIDTEASIGTIQLDDCKAFVKDAFKPTGARLYVVGDITMAEVQGKIGKRLKDWKGAGKKLPAIGKAAPRKGRIFFVDVPGAAQSVILMGHLGPLRTAKDYFETMIMNGVLGGNFASRINMNLREKHGYSYGASSGFRYFKGAGLFLASSSVKTDTTKPSITEMYKEFTGIRTGDSTAEEIDREKNGAIRALPAGLATGQQILAQFKAFIYYGLPLNYLDGYVASVQKVTKAQVDKAAKEHLHPEDVIVVVVGDGEKILPGLMELIDSKALGEGVLVKLDADGKVLAQ